jgi:hypothetical protein
MNKSSTGGRRNGWRVSGIDFHAGCSDGNWTPGADRQDDMAAGRESCGKNHRHVAAQQGANFLPGDVLIGAVAESDVMPGQVSL